MLSTKISSASAAMLFVGGCALLFAPVEVLAWLAPGYPPSADWVGQLVGAGWLAIAGLNWLGRGSVLGGIYGRPVVFANVTLYLVSALVLLEAAVRSDTGAGLWMLTAIMCLLAAVYGWLLLRGPAERDLEERGP